MSAVWVIIRLTDYMQIWIPPQTLVYLTANHSCKRRKLIIYKFSERSSISVHVAVL